MKLLHSLSIPFEFFLNYSSSSSFRVNGGKFKSQKLLPFCGGGLCKSVYSSSFFCFIDQLSPVFFPPELQNFKKDFVFFHTKRLGRFSFLPSGLFERGRKNKIIKERSLFPNHHFQYEIKVQKPSMKQKRRKTPEQGGRK